MTKWMTVTALVALLSVTSPNADPADLGGGVFIAHHPAALQFSTDPPAGGWCSEYSQAHAIESCEAQVNRIDSYDGVIWFVLAAWTEAKQWCGTEFGLASFDPEAFAIIESGPCFPENGLELSTPNWPGPGEGTAFVVTDTPWAGNFVAVYYFAGYAYSATAVSLTANPQTGSGGTANCSNPPETWPAEAFGAIGLFVDGISVCPDSVSANPPDSVVAVCCVAELCYTLSVNDCLALGGSYHGEQVNCRANLCWEIRERACCLEGGECILTNSASCLALGGDWIEDRSTCEPDPCGTSDASTSWGTIKLVHD